VADILKVDQILLKQRLMEKHWQKFFYSRMEYSRWFVSSVDEFMDEMHKEYLNSKPFLLNWE